MKRFRQILESVDPITEAIAASAKELAKEIDAAARRETGQDKKDYMNVAKLIATNKYKEAVKFMSKLDTMPLEDLVVLIMGHEDVFKVMYPKARPGQFVANFARESTIEEALEFHVRLDRLDRDKRSLDKVNDLLKKHERAGHISFEYETDKGVVYTAKSKSYIDAVRKDVETKPYYALVDFSESVELDEGKYQKYSDLLIKKAKLVAQGPIASKEVADINKQIAAEMKNLGVKEEVEFDEAFTPKDVKMAIGVASDKRYAGGNMTGAVNAIEKIKKGLSDHPQVKAVLKKQNESDELEEAMSPADKAKRLKMIRLAVEKINKNNAELAKKDALRMMKDSGMFDD